MPTVSLHPKPAALRGSWFVLGLLAAALVVSIGCPNGENTPPPPMDSQPPTAPANLVATANGATEIDLSWTASTDNVAVTGYRVESCQGAGCGSFAQIATPSGTTFNNTGLTASTSYSYRVRATDAANNLSVFSGTATRSTGAGGGPISVLISPKRGGLTQSQTAAFTATVTNDVGAAGVTWTKTGGTFAGQTATSVTFSSAAAGSFTITATSNADNTKSASATFGVTDLPAVSTYHNNLSRDGTNMREFALTPGLVSSTSTFGKLFSCAVDGEVYAQPLWVANLAIGGGTHNVVFVATQHDSVYAYDADNGSGTTCTQYWKVSLLNGGTSVNPSDTGEIGDISGEIGITGTPVIDASTSTLYVVSKTKEGLNYHQRLHALSLTTGIEKFGGPLDLTPAITVLGDADIGDSSVGCTSTPGNVPFCPLRENQRPGLVLVNGTVYIAWAAHGDRDPYHGWVMGFNAGTLARTSTFNTSPMAIGSYARGGIWMSGGAPAVDSSNNLYVITGNGTWDGITNFGDSFLKLSSALSVSDWFTPFNQASLDAVDLDLGSGGAVVLVDLPASSPVQHLLVGGGKGAGFAGDLYVLNRDNMGRFSASGDNVVQRFSLGGGIFTTGAFWQNTLYIGAVGQRLKAFALNSATSQFNTAATSQSSSTYMFPGTTPSVSSSGTTNGIVWALDTTNNGTPNGSGTTGPAVLHAYNATNLATELWNSSQAAGGRDTAGPAVKFVVPTIANGKVYIGTQTEITVYGLLPN